MAYNTRSRRAENVRDACTKIGLDDPHFVDLDWYVIAFVDKTLGADDPLFNVIGDDIAAIHVFGRIADRIKMVSNGVLYSSRCPIPGDFRYGDKMVVVQDFEWPSDYRVLDGEGSFSDHIYVYNLIYSYYYMLAKFWNDFDCIHGPQRKFLESGEVNVFYKALFRIQECAEHFDNFVINARYDACFDSLAVKALDGF